MKKLLSYSTVFFLVFCLCSCGKGIVEQGESGSGNQATDEAYQKAQEIYRLTGCKVINAQTINTLNEVFIDSKGYKYLYGARNAGIMIAQLLWLKLCFQQFYHKMTDLQFL